MWTDGEARSIWILTLGALLLLLARIGVGTPVPERSVPITARVDRLAR
jgi:hypothetical protein